MQPSRLKEVTLDEVKTHLVDAMSDMACSERQARGSLSLFRPLRKIIGC